MENEHFGDLIADGIHRIQGGHGFLKNHGDSIPPNGPHLLHGKRDDIRSVEQDIAVNNSARRLRDKAHDGLGGHTFPATGLPHDAEHLAFGKKKRDIINCLGSTLEGVKIGLEFFNLQEMGVAIHCVPNQRPPAELDEDGPWSNPEATSAGGR